MGGGGKNLSFKHSLSLSDKINLKKFNMDKDNRQKAYESPQVEVVTVAVESGFLYSGEGSDVTHGSWDSEE